MRMMQLYGGRLAQYKSKPEVPLYEANDDDYEYDEFGQVIQYDQGEDEYGDDDQDWDEDEAEAAHAEVVSHQSEQSARSQQQLVSLAVGGLPPEAFYDDLGLVNCWQSAMLDYKFHHPTQFGPPTDPPRKSQDKHRIAPLWYGLAPTPSASAPSAPSVASKSKKKKKSKKRKQATDATDDPPAKKPRASSPTWTPTSPSFQRDASLPPVDEEVPPPAPLPPPPQKLAGPHLPSPSTFVPPPTPSASKLIARAYPTPPPMMPVDRSDADSTLNDENAEELLQNALWSWFNAGYQTGLYHAAMGLGGTGDGPSAGANGRNGA